MAFTLGSLLLASILFVNAIAVLNEQRFLSKSTQSACANWPAGGGRH